MNRFLWGQKSTINISTNHRARIRHWINERWIWIDKKLVNASAWKENECYLWAGSFEVNSSLVILYIINILSTYDITIHIKYTGLDSNVLTSFTFFHHIYCPCFSTLAHISLPLTYEKIGSWSSIYRASIAPSLTYYLHNADAPWFPYFGNSRLHKT